MQHVFTKLVALLTVKSIVTLALTACFIAKAATGDVPESLETIYMIVISFYFGTQVAKETKSG